MCLGVSDFLTKWAWTEQIKNMKKDELIWGVLHLTFELNSEAFY